MLDSRKLVLYGLAVSVAACGGGGGGGGPDGSRPTLVAAAFVGAASTPAAGEVLLLVMSEAVAIANGALLTDDDLVLPAGATLGTAPQPTVVDARTVRIVLGAGAAFTPGTTTVAFSDRNDAIRDLAGNFARGGTPVTITVGDGQPPAVSLLTLNALPNSLNGTGPAGGTLQVPRSGFTIHVTASDDTGIDAARAALIADVPVVVNGAPLAPGADLAPHLTRTVNGPNITWLVPAGVAFPPGAVTLTASVVDTTGLVSTPASFAFRTIEATPGIRPFESTQLWYLDTSRDIESFTVETDEPPTRVTDVVIVAGANQRSDLEDLFRVVGLHGASAPVNALVTARFRAVVIETLERLFQGADVTFTWDPPGAFPSGSLSLPYPSPGFSRICIGGAALPTPSGTLGAALLDPNNATQNDNCAEDFQGIRLGVFLHTAIRIGYLSGGPTSTFRSTYEPLTPALGGTPIGNDANDAARLSNSPPPDARTDLIDRAIDHLGRLTAVVLAHECGHSMGLVKNGPMPTGLYGNDPVNFPLSQGQPPSNADAHIQNQALFPGDAQNVMSPAIDFDASLSDATGFNPLNLAYLRERALYDEDL